MQKTRSILFLREVVEQLDQEDTDQSRNITFRDKDLTLLNEECKDKYDQLTHLVSEVPLSTPRNNDSIANCSNSKNNSAN
jgi:hypothetical protein